MAISIPPTKFADPGQQIRFFNRILERVRAVPGVESVGTNDDLPLVGGSHEPILAEGWPVVPMSDQPEVDVRIISPGYLSAMRIPLLSGRDVRRFRRGGPRRSSADQPIDGQAVLAQ